MRLHIFPTLLSAVCVILLAAAPLLAQSPKTVTATGRAAGTSLSAQDEARTDALRQAVRQACGAFINSQTQVENYAAIYDHVMELAPGLVTGYNLDREWQEGEVSFCTVTATVEPADVILRKIKLTPKKDGD